MIPHPHRVSGAPTSHLNDQALPLPRPQLTLPLLEVGPEYGRKGP
jgi:hypothetical protein